MKFKVYFTITTIALLLASCASNKYADITRVHPDNQITGKGSGYSIQEQPKNFDTPAPETKVSEEYAVEESSSNPSVTTDISISEEKTDVRPQVNILEEKASINVEPQNFATTEKSTVDLQENYPLSSFNESTSNQYSEVKTKKKGFFKKLFSPKVDILYVILAILLPPLAVGLLVGLTGEFWLNLLLTILFYIPGLIHALYIVFRET